MAATSALGTRSGSLFDVDGRCIPVKVFDRVTFPDRSHHVEQPVFDNTSRLQRVTSFLNSGDILPSARFDSDISMLLQNIATDARLKNVLRGPHFPVGLPRIPAGLDYGEVLEVAFFPLLEASYREAFPDRHFQNQCKGRLKGKIKHVPDARHDKLTAAMHVGPVSAIFFPLALWGYSVRAAQQQIEALPDAFLLSGAFDVTMAFAMYPRELARDKLVPGIGMAGVHWRSQRASVYLKGSGQALHFCYMGPLGHASTRYSNGLLYVG